MKVFSRDFTLREKIILLVLCIVLVGLAYYKFVDSPVRTAIQEANGERETLEIELTALQAQIGKLESMKDELEEVSAKGNVSMMGSYNNSKAEMKMLNDILEAADQFSISFDNVTRDGDQIRRNFTLQFTAANYDVMTRILFELSNGKYRCLIGNVQCSSENGDVQNGKVTVGATATFYETMVGGKEDSLLPKDEAAVQEETP